MMTGFGGNRSIVIGLHLDPRGVRAGLAVARREMTDFARAGAEASRKHKRAYDDVANGIGAAGLALGAFAAVAVVSFARFDKAMSRAGAGTQATASQMTALRAAAIRAGADTAFSATQAADAITEMGKAGVSVQDILGGGLKGTLALAAAGELEVARASEIAATTMTQFGLTGKDVGHVADVLAAGAGKAQGSVEDLAQGLKFVGPVAAQAGITLEQTTGVLAEFASQGIIGEQAGTTFRSVLASLTAPSKLAAKEMDRLGISMYDTNGRFIGMEGAAQELQEKLGSLSAAQRNAALEIIFGREAMTGATVLYKGGAAAVRDWTDKVNDQGFAAEQAGKLMDNLAGDVEKLKGSLETAFISSGSGANDGLRAIVSTVDGAVDAFNGLPGPVQKSTVVIAAVGGAALIATAGLLKLVGAAAAAKVNLAALGVSAATTKASLVAVGKVGAAAAGLYALGQAADEINSSVGDSAVTVADLSKALEELGKRGQSEIQVGKFGKGFEDIGKQLKELSQADLLDRFNDAQASFLNFIQLRDLPEGRQNRGKILEDFRRLDAELTRMVNSGNLEGAQEQFGLLNQKAIAGGAGVNQLARHLPQYEAAVAQAGQTTEDAAGAADGYTASQRGALAASKALEAGQEGLKTALDAASNAFLVGRSASRDYQAAIDAAKESAKTNGETLDENTEKGRANAASLDALATSSLAYLGTLTGPNGEATPKFNRALEDSRVRLIAAARGFGMGEAAAKAYAAKILDVPARRRCSSAWRVYGACRARRRTPETLPPRTATSSATTAPAESRTMSRRSRGRRTRSGSGPSRRRAARRTSRWRRPSGSGRRRS
jgi:TP901 family phage tail tape measure protein